MSKERVKLLIPAKELYTYNGLGFSKNQTRGRSGLKVKKKFDELEDLKPLSDEEFEELLNTSRRKYRKPKIRY